MISSPVPTHNKFNLLTVEDNAPQPMDNEDYDDDNYSTRVRSQPSTSRVTEWPDLPVKSASQPAPLAAGNSKSATKLTLKRSEQGYYILNPPPDPTPPVSPLPVTQPESRPPPIIVRGRNNFAKVKALSDGNEVVIKEYRDCPEGLKVFPETIDGFRKLRNVFEDSLLSFHLFQLKEEKELRIVLRGVPQDLDIAEVEEDLKLQGFHFSSVSRMKRGTKIFPMVMLTAPKTEEGRRCFDIVHVMRKRVTAEHKRKQVGGSQCYKCQRFGHVSGRCFGEVRCAFCLVSHPSSECPKERGPGKEVQCVNCQGTHPSFARSCPQHPLQVQARRDELRRTKLASATRQEGISYAQKTLGDQHPTEAMSQSLRNQIHQAVEASLKQLLPSLLASFNGK